MSDPPEPADGPAPVPEKDGVAAIVDRIASELAVQMARADRVEADCAALRRRLDTAPSPGDIEHLARLGAALRSRSGPAVATAARLLESVAEMAPDPWPILEPLLTARDRDVARGALGAAWRLAETGRLACGHREALALATAVEIEESPLSTPEALRGIAALLRARSKDGGDAVLALLLDGEDLALRVLAARLLDVDGAPAPAETAQRILGSEAHGFLRCYLDYTRAGHLDLLHLAPRRGEPPVVLDGLRRAERVCGEKVLRQIVAELGWRHLGCGLEALRYASIRVGPSLPLLVRPEEAPLFEGCEDARRGQDVVLVVAQGGLPSTETFAPVSDDPVSRYRACNLAHAEALQEILDVAPLGRERVLRLLALMDRIVGDHVTLFAEHADECAILPSIWSELRARIVTELGREASEPSLSAELTRLVLMFEDPASAGAVTTLHGLKRYLHQRGLRLGFRLVKTVSATNRTVNLVVASGDRVSRSLTQIRYVDFEPVPDAPTGPAGIPYPVWIVAEGFARQLLHGHGTFPSARVFCYGNEVHYYLTYGSHPAFLRIDFAPPLQGGMVDLEYYGVSRYDLESHPNRELDAVRLFFRRLEYDVQIEPNTRVHARYDKERARDLGDLCEKAEALFRLAPHLMDLDWKLGDLVLPADGRAEAARAWAEIFERWGFLPVDRMLTRDRLGIVTGVEATAAGERETVWSGGPPYRDRFTTGDLGGLFSGLRDALAALGVEEAVFAEDAAPPLGQIALERAVLRPLREAVARGELIVTDAGLRPAPPERFERSHEAEAFARILASADDVLAASSRLARLVAPLERTLAFRTTGAVNRHDVQRARLALRGGSVGLHVLRGPRGLMQLALFTRGGFPCRRRPTGSEPWETDISVDAAALGALLRSAGYASAGTDPAVDDVMERAEALREQFGRPNPMGHPVPIPGERIVSGVAAAPGRAVGRALLGTERRAPRDFVGAVLFSPSLRPEHGPFLHTAAAVATTGGGILSHAGLLATQYRKPALIVPGVWADDDGAPRVRLKATEFREETQLVEGYRVVVRRDVWEREVEVRDGDLVAIDADQGTLQVLGQDPLVVGLHEGIRALGSARRSLASSPDEAAVLTLRGEMLRARHRIESTLMRLADPVVARFAIHEILLGPDLGGDGAGEKVRLLNVALANPAIARPSGERLVHIGRVLSRRLRDACDEAGSRIPVAETVYEVLARRLEVLRLRAVQGDAALALRECGFETGFADVFDEADVDIPSRRRLEELRAALAASIAGGAGPDADPAVRHRCHALARLAAVLGATGPPEPAVDAARERLREVDRAALDELQERRVLDAGHAGFEASGLVGWKAANLAEIVRLAGPRHVPAWFVVTDTAFREALELPSPRRSADAPRETLRESIENVLARRDFDLRAKAGAIGALWDEAAVPEGVAKEVAAAYRRLAQAASDPADAGEGPFVAVRSSAREEDTEQAANAGEFDTFLFVRGERSLLDNLKRAWAGLWNERALHARAALGAGPGPSGGGVIVQRMARSRVSGVLQTVHVAEGDPREIVVNAGLGLGEGIVAGAVGADQITVSKEGDLERGPLRFRYLTADKREQVVFDRRSGSGTVRVDTAYHQRLRPALEYVELLELVGVSVRLERIFGHPLDIEFAIEGSRLWLLQVRPVPAYDAVLRETLKHHPLPATARAAGGAIARR